MTELAERHGRPLSLVGWSLGGIYAREFARATPSRVRQVITLGTPFRLRDRRASNAGVLFDAFDRDQFHVRSGVAPPWCVRSAPVAQRVAHLFPHSLRIVLRDPSPSRPARYAGSERGCRALRGLRARDSAPPATVEPWRRLGRHVLLGGSEHG